MNKIMCKLSGGHRYKSLDLEIISEDDIYIFRHKCCKCGNVKEWVVPKAYFIIKAEKGRDDGIF